MVYWKGTSEVKKIRNYLFFPTFILFSFAFFSSAHACTIWAATGESVKEKGSIIAKNRDNLPHLYTILKAVFPEKGFGFFGIFDIEADGYVTAGINEKGLVVVNASANSVPAKKRHVATEDLTERLLTSFDSVKSLLAERDIFRKSHPAIYIIGDASSVASIEVAPGGKISVTTKEKGVLAFTNHYTDNKLFRANERLSSSSFMRLNRINQLMTEQATPFTLKDFIRFSNDTNGGAGGALWRVGALPGKIRTLASWIVSMPPKGPPELYVKLVNPDEPEIVHRLRLDSLFWEQQKNLTTVSGEGVNEEKPDGNGKELMYGHLTDER
ncbi:MAG: hypothetical protein C0399_02545 [Syntrophus sp. (in: bacteria)]|nr:hypothetical protein [Syntrophus sp. (in: bacteria)]